VLFFVFFFGNSLFDAKCRIDSKLSNSELRIVRFLR